jgi:cyclohexa-1,5-dienecarbonyl-CoA hydratase
MSIAPPRSGRAVASTIHAGGAVVRIEIDAPKGNILSREVIALLHEELRRAQADPAVGLVTLEGAGANFSYGASVAEHLPDEIEQTLPALHRLVLEIAASPAPVASLVRGRCLGGAFEVAAAGHFIFAAPDARFALPEIRLGVFPPAGCSLLPMRLGQTLCDRMVITGQELDAAALRPSGFITAIFPSDELFGHALEWHRRWIAPSSVASLRMATVASRHGFLRCLRQDLHALEEAYLQKLAPTEDAIEGIQAFLGKRDPVWRNR